MGVLLRRTPVRRPARVPDAGRAPEWLLAQQPGQVIELAHAAADLDVVVREGREARRVVAAVLELAESRDENRARLTRAHVSDNAAHRSAPSPRAALDRRPAPRALRGRTGLRCRRRGGR